MTFISDKEFKETKNKQAITYSVAEQVISYTIGTVSKSLKIPSSKLLLKEQPKVLMCSLILNDIPRVFKTFDLEASEQPNEINNVDLSDD